MSFLIVFGSLGLTAPENFWDTALGPLGALVLALILVYFLYKMLRMKDERLQKSHEQFIEYLKKQLENKN